jgi:16S rRNA (uracil1498-N3)-methyltransferase
MAERFYIADSLAEPTARLDGAAAHHLLHVSRLKAGEEVRLFDGRGTVATAQIMGSSKNSVELRLIETIQFPQESGRPVSVATAVPKGDRFRWLVEKATELGVRRLTPIRTCRSVVHPGDGKLAKIRQTVISACQQSGRNWLMEIDPVASWNEILDQYFAGHVVLVAHPAGKPLQRRLSSIAGSSPLLLVVGPEGGFTDAEIDDAVTAGAMPVNLGENILRIETAAVALIAVCRLATSP